MSELEKRVLETLKECESRNESPLVWAIQLSNCVGGGGGGGGSPSPELAEVLVSYLCFSNNTPSLWKCLHLSLSSSSLLYPPHLLSLLASRIIPRRQSQPAAFTLYLQLLITFPFSFHIVAPDATKHKIIKSIDIALQLSQKYEVQIRDLGFTLVLYFFDTVLGLIDCVMDDWGLQINTSDTTVGSQIKGHTMEIDFEGKIYEQHEEIKRTNTNLLSLLAELLEKQKAVVLLRLVHLNLPEKFNTLLQKLQFLEAHMSSSSKLKSSSQLLLKLSANIRRALVLKCEMRKSLLMGMLTDVRSRVPVSCYASPSGRFPCWVSFDVCMETAMDGKQFPVTSAINILSETITTLHIFNRASWQETFLALWLSALRLVQRERDPLEGPVPHLDARLCILLSITPLAIAQVLADDSKIHSSLSEDRAHGFIETECQMSGFTHDSKRQGLITALQHLGIHNALLCPPASAVIAANKAASKAASFISKMKNINYGFAIGNCEDMLVKAGGDLRHLIVEACIARKLVDTSAYSWPGYVSASLSCLSDPSPLQRSPWSTFMEGAPLSGPLINALISTPASSLTEIEKLHHIALNGTEVEKSAAAKIICGASLICGWNIQEHVVRIVVKLLSPPEPTNHKGPMSHLIDYLPMLSSILFGVTSVDSVHILSLHGMVPEVAASLIPLCEVFGSLEPLSTRSASAHEESIYLVFSYAFLFLLRLWKFYRPPLEQCITGRGGVIGGELTLEYLLLLRNSRIQSCDRALSDGIISNSSMLTSVSDKPIYIDSYPKLRAWYCQNKSCIASTLSGLCIRNPVHQVANKILNMIFWKMTKSETVSSNISTAASSTTSDSSDMTENPCRAAVLPAWEVLEAIPYVLEAILTACAHGRLSSRDLTTGLRDLVDFLPASLAAIISYFSAEITRGTWKPVLMNGMDWPSPAANFLSVESEIKEILAAAGVSINIPSCSSGIPEAMLPLPMAALVSLTITFKLDKSLEYIQAVVGPALENCASNCAWPSMPIVSSLWAQKVRRWSDFIVVSCSRSVFRQDQEAVSQLLRSCFTSFLGLVHPSTSSLMSLSGVNGLLGTYISARGLYPPVAPGFLYLRSCRMIQNVRHVNNVILGLVCEFARELAKCGGRKRNSPQLKSSQESLAVAAARAREIATLGASLLYVAGGLELVQELYKETIPTWLLSSNQEKKTLCKGNTVSKTLEGYAMAYLLVLSGALAWGINTKQPSGTGTISRRSSMVKIHMDFVAEISEGKMPIGCDPVTWKAYVTSLVGLVARLAPLWLQDVKVEAIRKLANVLREWNEFELSMLLLERGGIETMGSIVQLLNFMHT